MGVLLFIYFIAPLAALIPFTLFSSGLVARTDQANTDAQSEQALSPFTLSVLVNIQLIYIKRLKVILNLYNGYFLASG